MMRVTLTLLGILACAAVFTVMADGASAGTIRGPVRLTGGAVEQKKLAVTVDQSVCGKDKDAEDIALSPDKGVRNAVVSLQNPAPGAKWKAVVTPQIDQRQCVFVPRVVVVPVGGTVEFLNGDRLLHNIRSLNEGSSFNRTQPKGRTIPIVFKKPDIIRVGCDLHPWMQAWVVVAEHPFYALTDEQGEFVLDNVPPGQYTLQVWHETLGTMRKDVTVGDGVTPVTVEMTAK